jgi:hypothetical protein
MKGQRMPMTLDAADSQHKKRIALIRFAVPRPARARRLRFGAEKRNKKRTLAAGSDASSFVCMRIGARPGRQPRSYVLGRGVSGDRAGPYQRIPRRVVRLPYAADHGRCCYGRSGQPYPQSAGGNARGERGILGKKGCVMRPCFLARRQMLSLGPVVPRETGVLWGVSSTMWPRLRCSLNTAFAMQETHQIVG